MSDRSTVLFELGTEELPPKSIEPLAAALRQGVLNGLEEAGIAVSGSVVAYSTPRRLAVVIEGMPSRQPNRTETRLGPPVAAAYDGDGEPTKAASGFARSCGTTVDQLQQLESPKGLRLGWVSEIEGAAAADLLPDILRTSLESLPVAKPMRWGDNTASFVRPVHWVVLLFGDQVIESTFFECKADRITHGHRVHCPQPIALNRAEDYLGALRNGYVLADPEERQKTIREQVATISAEAGLDPVVPTALLNEVTNLVEWPIAMSGGFDPAFLEVPEEAIISSLQAHQKMFSLRDHQGVLSNRFITITNLESQAPEEVRKGYERVVEPRLADAQFFWQQDLKKPLADLRPVLDSVTFQHHLGSIGDKVERMQQLGASVVSDLGVDPGDLKTAIMLCKCDLLTDMVGEFPDLQGVMGQRYALAQDLDAAVAGAIASHYQPRFAGDDIAADRLGQAVGLVDRIDTLAGIFAAGLKPTGNKDPFALRRAALGLIRTIVESEVALDLSATFAFAVSNLPENMPNGDCQGEVLGFVWERARGYFAEQAVTSDVFDAVLAVQNSDLLDFSSRCVACMNFRSSDAAESLAAANKRVANILKKSDEGPGDAVQEALLTDDAEKALFQALREQAQSVSSAVQVRDYGAALNTLGTLKPAVDRFFDEVLVMAPEPEVRANRLALLQEMRELFLQIADVGKLAS